MTMPEEAHRAVIATRRFLFDLLDPAKTPRVPRDIRLRARALAKHYPFDCEVQACDFSESPSKVKIRPS